MEDVSIVPATPVGLTVNTSKLSPDVQYTIGGLPPEPPRRHFISLLHGMSQAVKDGKAHVGSFWIGDLELELKQFLLIPIGLQASRRFVQHKGQSPPWCYSVDGLQAVRQGADGKPFHEVEGPTGTPIPLLCLGDPARDIDPCSFKDEGCNEGRSLLGYLPEHKIAVRMSFFDNTLTYDLPQLNTCAGQAGLTASDPLFSMVLSVWSELYEGKQYSWHKPKFKFERRTTIDDLPFLEAMMSAQDANADANEG